MFGQKNDDNPADQGVPGEAPMNDGAGGHPPIASAATDPMASLSDNAAWQHPGVPVDDSSGSASQQQPVDVISPAGGFPSAASNRISPDESDAPAEEQQVTQSVDDLVSGNDVDNGNLIEIKQKVLHELAPLVDQLDQPPEEKFRTIMMLLQASDDQELVEHAYVAAHSIEDEKARAQALLDIVNEINYFTQQQPGAQPQQ